MGRAGSPDDAARFQPRVWSSPDGITWTEGAFPSGPVDVGEIIWTGSSFLALGVRRLNAADPGSGPFGAALFRSADGAAWEEVPLDPAVFGEPAPDDYFTDIVELAGRLVGVKAVPNAETRELRMFEEPPGCM